jgi:DNA-binding transcriptional ArsR family regulator
MADRPLPELEVVRARAAAAALLDPGRARILAVAREPVSATEIARRLELPRQRVHYHVRELERAGLLRPAGRRRRGNLIEQRFVATARSYALSPGLLGPVAADWREMANGGSPDYLLALTEQVRDDLSGLLAESREAPDEHPTIAIKAQFRIETEAQRAAFAAAVREAIVAAIARHTSPDRPDGRPGRGRAHRLVLACYPMPTAAAERTAETEEEEP